MTVMQNTHENVEQLIGTLQLQRDGVSETLSVMNGWTDDQKRQIIDRTVHDAQVCKLTDDPSRFLDEQTLTQWLAKRPRHLYVVLDAQQAVVGSFWVAQKSAEHPAIGSEFGWTLAIRLYAHARGAGLAYPVMQVCIQHHRTTVEYRTSDNPGYWLRTKLGNIPARKTYEKFGFTTVVEDAEYVWMTWMPQ